jgi:beta-glucanase (GH16 family)
MKRVVLLLATTALTLGAGLMVAEPAQAASGITIRTIPAKTVPYGGTVVIKPLVTVRGTVRIGSRTLTVKRGTTYLKRGVTYARLFAGHYYVSTTVKYRVRSGGSWGRLRTSVRAQTLHITSEVAPAAEPPVIDESAVSKVPCGSQVHQKADGSPWVCSFADEFTGAELDRTKWSPQQTAVSGIHVGPECIVDDADNVMVSAGLLRLTALKEPAPFACDSPYGDYTTNYTSGGVTTWGKFSQAYGRFEFRVKFPTTKIAGLQSSLWLYPVAHTYGGWPASGEIDIAEAYTSHPDRAIPYIHYNTAIADDPSVTNWFCKLDLSTFHTYVGVWTPTSITISYDGNVCMEHAWDAATLTGSQPFDQPFAVILTQVLGGGTTNAFNPDTTPLPATTEVDWVRVWS